MDETLSDFLRQNIRSIWNVELLLLLHRQSGRPWQQAELVRELRASDVVVSEGTASLRQAGLILAEADDTIRYCPASATLDRLVQQLDRVYRERPTAVTKALFSAPSSSLQAFSDAFRLKKD
jgi:hypothetical protein